jgi:hypothetical protein
MPRGRLLQCDARFDVRFRALLDGANSRVAAFAIKVAAADQGAPDGRLRGAEIPINAYVPAASVFMSGDRYCPKTDSVDQTAAI